jgi:SAM-dependent methyltransferase
MMHRLLALLGPWRPALRRMRRPFRLGRFDTAPLSTEWGFDRGTPIDRYYIERFLDAHAADVRGRVLEVKSSEYTRRFDRGVVRADVLDIDPKNEQATIVADLTEVDQVPAGQFDCFILTQTLQFIYDVHAAVRHSHRLLAPGGVLLVTVPVVARISPRYGPDTEFWRFTVASCRRLFGDVFGSANVEIVTYGNVLADMAFLQGAALEEFPRAKLEVNDPYFPLIVAVRAVRSEDAVSDGW